MSTIEEALEAIRKTRASRVVVFTGAGVSADSGVPTFRGADGLWRNFRSEDLATPAAFHRDPQLVWEWYEWRRSLIRDAEPNAAHRAIARIPDCVVVTQNVDNLHTRGGAKDVLELHGNIFRVRCVREGTTSWRPDAFAQIPPSCECGAMLRPDVVWFGEMLPESVVVRAVNAIHSADLLLIIGTSGVVFPAAGFVAEFRGLSIEINPQASAVSSACTYAIPARAAEATPRIVNAILEAQS
ncbi:MAG TPA: NAD-dependent deacylase [Thermoanaerobaculia bacterium]|nr:NAD-dependent deacylase [Thermoanaerobaculia bacterium]